MATKAQVTKIAKARFIPELEEIGFCFFEGLCAYRINNDIYQFIVPSVFNKGWNLRISVYCWVPELDKYNMKTFPNNILLGWAGGHVGGNRKNSYFLSANDWCIKDTENISSALDDALKSVLNDGLSFFDKVHDRKTLAEFLEYQYKDEYEAMIDEGEPTLYSSFVELKNAVLNLDKSNS